MQLASMHASASCLLTLCTMQPRVSLTTIQRCQLRPCEIIRKNFFMPPTMAILWSLNLSNMSKCWELESLGVLNDKPSGYDKFTQKISFNGTRYMYVVNLPWKDSHPCLPDNYAMCWKRLKGLLRRLNQDKSLLLRYYAIMKEQLRQGIIKIVP